MRGHLQKIHSFKIMLQKHRTKCWTANYLPTGERVANCDCNKFCCCNLFDNTAGCSCIKFWHIADILSNCFWNCWRGDRVLSFSTEDEFSTFLENVCFAFRVGALSSSTLACFQLWFSDFLIFFLETNRSPAYTMNALCVYIYTHTHTPHEFPSRSLHEQDAKGLVALMYTKMM